MGIWIVSSVGVLGTQLLSSLSMCAHLLGLYLDEEVLSHGVCMCSALVDVVRKFCPVDVYIYTLITIYEVLGGGSVPLPSSGSFDWLNN